jgi:hypothetical protein
MTLPVCWSCRPFKLGLLILLDYRDSSATIVETWTWQDFEKEHALYVVPYVGNVAPVAAAVPLHHVAVVAGGVVAIASLVCAAIEVPLALHVDDRLFLKLLGAARCW